MIFRNIIVSALPRAVAGLTSFRLASASSFALPASACVSCSSFPRSLHTSPLVLREQFNKDKERMKKKKEKAIEEKKKGKNSDSSSSADSDVGVSVPAMEEKMREYIDNMRTAYSLVKAGRVVPNQLDEIQVNAHGQTVPLKAVGSVSARNAQTLVVQLYDPSVSKEVDKAIRLHNNTLNPTVEENSIVVVFPKMTKEVREGLIKTIGKRSEETRNHLRNLRQTYLQQLKALEKSKDISEDLNKELKQQIQNAHDHIAAEIKKLQEEKEKEIKEV